MYILCIFDYYLYHTKLDKHNTLITPINSYKQRPGYDFGGWL